MVPEGWKEMPLGKLARITSGATPKVGTSHYYESGNIPFLKIQDLTAADSLMVGDAGTHITSIALEETSAKLYPEGTVLVTMYGTIGAVRITSRPMAANQAIAAFLDLKSTDSVFLAWLLRYHQRHLESLAFQTTQANISGRVLKSYRVALPPFQEQKQIAAILTSVDDAIAATRKVVEQAKRVKKGLLQDLMTRGIGHTRFKKTEIGKIPEAWEVVRLSQVVSTGITYGVVKPGEYVDDGVPFVRGGDLLGEEGLGKDTLKRITREVSDQYSRTLLQGGEVLVSLVGQPGAVAVAPSDLQDANISRAVGLIRLKRMLPEFVASFIRTRQGQRQFFLDAIGSVQQVVNLRDLKSLIVPHPPLSEQTEIVDYLRTVSVIIQRAREQVTRMSHLKRGLMQDLLTGRVRVNVD